VWTTGALFFIHPLAAGQCGARADDKAIQFFFAKILIFGAESGQYREG